MTTLSGRALSGVTDLSRFIACMEYQSADRRPNHELGVWGQTRERWEREAPDRVKRFTWDWFAGESALGMDAREFMGTENLSYAWYDYPDLMHEMMAFFADFIIETSRPVLKKVQVDYFVLNEDMSMKNGPLLGPETFRTFIFPHLKRLVDFLRSHGTRYVAVDSDGDPTALVPLLLDAGVDTLWPIERAANVSSQQLRKRFGKSLRLWGGVDKRVLSRGREAMRQHLQALIPLIEEGGFIPSVDHTVPPDVSWSDFMTYMELKTALLSGDFDVLF